MGREDFAGDSCVVVEVQQESHGVVAGEVVLHEEVCPENGRCDIRDGDIPVKLAIAEPDGHVTGSIAGDGTVWLDPDIGQKSDL